MTNHVPFPPSTEVGSLGICHLKRLWSSAIAARSGGSIEREDETQLDRLVMNALGLGVHETIQHVCHNAPTFSEFEDWVAAIAGSSENSDVARLNARITGTPYPDETCRWLDSVEGSEPVLSPDDLSFWEKNGYVVLRDAVDSEARTTAEQVIWQHVGADPDVTESWYQNSAAGIMIELIRHPAFERNRRAVRIHKAFAQLWGTADLWVSADRCGFHVPQREDRPFPGPDLHWDIDFALPLEFGTQGILYLTETPPEQGALTLVPGFHHRLSDWLRSLEPGVDPQQQDLHALGSVPVGGYAGDMVIWHQALPHGSRPNLGTRPRIVQYINMIPGPGGRRKNN